MTKAIFDEICGVLSGLPSQERWDKANSPKGYYFVMETWDDALALAALTEAIKTEKFRPTPHDMYRCMVNVLSQGAGELSVDGITQALGYAVSTCDSGDTAGADAVLKELIVAGRAHPAAAAAVPVLGGWRAIGNSKSLAQNVMYGRDSILKAYSESAEQYASAPPAWPKILEAAERVERITGKPWAGREIGANPVAMLAAKLEEG